MNGHTPGPWFVRHCDDERHMCMTVVSAKDYGPSNDSQFDGEQDTIAITYHQCLPFVSGGFEIDDCDERDANARLIAAAPELLEALKAMRIVMDMDAKPTKLDAALTWRECDEKARSMCDAAIAAATGEAT